VSGETEIVVEVGRADLQPLDEIEALQKKAHAPCDRHENGDCDCGKTQQ
jgi:hypothetical protein